MMKKIGLVDDNPAQRKAFKLKINLKLEELFPNWSICDISPFKDIQDYRQWILENDISVLILDERLHLVELGDGTFVNYNGSDLVIELRNYFKDIPIYCITTYEISQSLKETFSYFNLILSRKKFDEDIDNYLNSFVRSGISFYENYQNELNRLGELSEKIALGTATEEEVQETLGLQTRLIIPHTTEQIADRENYLKDLEGLLTQIKSISGDIQQKINNIR